MMKTQISTRFGVIEDCQQVRLKSRGNRTHTLALQQITSVRQQVDRKWGLGILTLLAAMALYPAIHQPATLMSILLLSTIGTLCLWGSPTVVITTVGGVSRRIKGAPWHVGDADRFVSALRGLLFEQRTQAASPHFSRFALNR